MEAKHFFFWKLWYVLQCRTLFWMLSPLLLLRPGGVESVYVSPAKTRRQKAIYLQVAIMVNMFSQMFSILVPNMTLHPDLEEVCYCGRIEIWCVHAAEISWIIYNKWTQFSYAPWKSLSFILHFQGFENHWISTLGLES